MTDEERHDEEEQKEGVEQEEQSGQEETDGGMLGTAAKGAAAGAAAGAAIGAVAAAGSEVLKSRGQEEPEGEDASEESATAEDQEQPNES